MSTPVPRRAGRVLLVNGQDRLLLFRGGDPLAPEAGTWWFTPGGGLDGGETFAEGAARELFEETGLRVAASDLGPVVHTRLTEFRWNGGHYLQDEEYFLLRVDAHEVDCAGLSALEQSSFVEHRWWPIGELLRTTETLYPVELAEVLTRVAV